MPKKTKTMPPVHPGETLREDFLKPLGLTANRLAIELQVPATRVNDIVRAKRSIMADTALRLSRYFGTTPQFWMNLQANYDLDVAQDARGSEIADRISPHGGVIDLSRPRWLAAARGEARTCSNMRRPPNPCSERTTSRQASRRSGRWPCKQLQSDQASTSGPLRHVCSCACKLAIYQSAHECCVDEITGLGFRCTRL